MTGPTVMYTHNSRWIILYQDYLTLHAKVLTDHNIGFTECMIYSKQDELSDMNVKKTRSEEQQLGLEDAV